MNSKVERQCVFLPRISGQYVNNVSINIWGDLTGAGIEKKNRFDGELSKTFPTFSPVMVRRQGYYKK